MKTVSALLVAHALVGLRPASADGPSMSLLGSTGDKYLVEDPDRSPLGSFGLAAGYRRPFGDRLAWSASVAWVGTPWDSPKFYREDGRQVPGSDFDGSLNTFEGWGRVEFAWFTGRLGVLSGLGVGVAVERVSVEWAEPVSGPRDKPQEGKYTAFYACASASPLILRWEARPGFFVRLQPEIGVNEFHGLGTLRSGGEDAFLLVWLGLEYGL